MRALIQVPSNERGRDDARREREAAVAAGATIVQAASTGTIVDGDDHTVRALAERGMRVTVLRVGATVRLSNGVELDADTGAPRSGVANRVPDDQRETWPLHVLHLRAPLDASLSEALRRNDCRVIGAIDAMTLLVKGAPGGIRGLLVHNSVAWSVPFEPAWKLAPSLERTTALDRRVVVDARLSPTALDDVRETIRRHDGKLIPSAPVRRPPVDVPAGVPPAERIRGGIRAVGAPRRPAPTGLRAPLIGLRRAPGPLAPIAQITTPRPFALSTRRPTALRSELRRDALEELARVPGVLWIEPSNAAVHDGDLEARETAGSLDAQSYQTWLQTRCAWVSDATVALCDTGVQSDHPSLSGRVFPAGTWLDDSNDDSHGTHVAGIIAGSAQPDGNGQGLAPYAKIASLTALNEQHAVVIDAEAIAAAAAGANARVLNNSWGGDIEDAAYGADCAAWDAIARGAGDDGTPPLTLVFSAGNKGPEKSSITAPHALKNAIVVGAARNRSASGAFDLGLLNTSSRGPTADGRLCPTVVAVGEFVSSTLPDNTYGTLSGTSQAAAHVSGACALLAGWWGRRSGVSPSPAMLRALLVNGAEDLAGQPDPVEEKLGHIPNNAQGWGRVNVSNVVFRGTGDDSRGPRLLVEHPGIAQGAPAFTLRVAAVETTRPMRATLAWTDPPGTPSATRALVNKLNLELASLNSLALYSGNPENFERGFSRPSASGGTVTDNLHNLECVYVEKPTDLYELRVLPTGVTVDAVSSDDALPSQDFALTIENAELVDPRPRRVVIAMCAASHSSREAALRVIRSIVSLQRVGGGMALVRFDAAEAVCVYPRANESGAIDSTMARARAAEAVNDLSGASSVDDVGAALVRGIAGASSCLGALPSITIDGGARDQIVVVVPDIASLHEPPQGFAEALGAVPDTAQLNIWTLGDYAPAWDLSAFTSLNLFTGGAAEQVLLRGAELRRALTGEALIKRTTVSSRTAFTVSLDAPTATFVLSWSDSNARYLDGGSAPGSITFEGPNGTVPTGVSWVQWFEGDGFAACRIEQPARGDWKVTVRPPFSGSARPVLAVYAGGDMALEGATARSARVGHGIAVRARLHGLTGESVTLRGVVRVKRPIDSLRKQALRLLPQLKNIAPPGLKRGDAVRRLLVAHEDRIAKGAPGLVREVEETFELTGREIQGVDGVARELFVTVPALVDGTHRIEIEWWADGKNGPVAHGVETSVCVVHEPRA